MAYMKTLIRYLSAGSRREDLSFLRTVTDEVEPKKSKLNEEDKIVRSLYAVNERKAA
jgi:hypothetical protein